MQRRHVINHGGITRPGRRYVDSKEENGNPTFFWTFFSVRLRFETTPTDGDVCAKRKISQ